MYFRSCIVLINFVFVHQNSFILQALLCITFVLFSFTKLLCWVTCRILVPQAGIKPMSSEVEAWAVLAWTTREVLHLFLFLVRFIYRGCAALAPVGGPSPAAARGCGRAPPAAEQSKGASVRRLLVLQSVGGKPWASEAAAGRQWGHVGPDVPWHVGYSWTTSCTGSGFLTPGPPGSSYSRLSSVLN